jgi:glycerol-3-phosphate dehydrogenase
MGAFPIRRGESDEESMKTALALLERGDAVVIFPEGTRIRRGALGNPKRGVGRMALQAGVPVVPIAVHGSERARPFGFVFKPVKVKLRVGRPLTFPRVDEPSKSLASEVTARIWPCVELQYEWLGGLPPLRKAAVVGAGSAGTATATLLARAGLDVQLGCRNADHADRIAATGENEDYLPGIELPDNVVPTTLADIEFAGVDLVVLAVPSSSLPQVVGSLGARIGDRSAVLALSKGLVQPLGTLPTRYVSERVGARAVAFLGGPSHAAESVDRGAHVVLASSDAALRDQLGEVLTKAGLDVERTDDVVGVQLAGAAKNAAALAAAAAATDGMNAAGAAASRVFAEVHELARAHGARTETFLGLAGAGDLVATALAEQSRNRRAGELLGQGVPGIQIPALLPQAAEGISSVPLLVEALDRENIACPACEALCGLIEGRIDRTEWIASVRRAA